MSAGNGLAAVAVVLLVGLASSPAAADASLKPRALTILPPGEGNTITVDRFLRNLQSSSCADLGPHTCDQLDMYKNWQFKDGALSPDADHVAGAVSSETPIAGFGSCATAGASPTCSPPAPTSR